MRGLIAVHWSRASVLGACVALAAALVVGSVGAPPAGAAKKPRANYIAMGDGLAFGWSLKRYNTSRRTRKTIKIESRRAFETSYVRRYYHAVEHAEKSRASFVEENLGCPRETSASLIGDGPVGLFMEAHLGATTESPCAYEEEWLSEKATFEKDEKEGLTYAGNGGELHLNLSNGDPVVERSQLEEALKRIYVDGEAHEEGAKLVTLDVGTADEEKLVASCEETEPLDPLGCVSAHAPAMIEQVTRNVADAIYVLRNAEALFPGQEYMDYTGKIVFVTGYDPYGTLVAGKGEDIPGSNELLAALTAAESHALEGDANVCIANMQAAFNPAFGDSGEEAHEAERLRNWTGMDRPGTRMSFPKTNGYSDGPDPSPTTKGYREMAAVIQADCGM